MRNSIKFILISQRLASQTFPPRIWIQASIAVYNYSNCYARRPIELQAHESCVTTLPGLMGSGKGGKVMGNGSNPSVVTVGVKPAETRWRFLLFLSESPSLCYGENLFKVYDGVETFVMFIGYPRSRHSLVAALLDAHPEIIIPHEYHVLENWRKYQSSILIQKNLQKYLLFYELHQLSTKQALFHFRAKSSFQTENVSYNYYVPGLWQGGYQNRIKVTLKGKATTF